MKGSYPFFDYLDLGCFLWKNVAYPHGPYNLRRSLITYNPWNNRFGLGAVILIKLHIRCLLNTSGGFMRTRYAWEFEAYPTNIPSYVFASNLANRVFLLRMKHLQPNTRKYLIFGFFPIRSSYGVLFLSLRRHSLLEA